MRIDWAVCNKDNVLVSRKTKKAKGVDSTHRTIFNWESWRCQVSPSKQVARQKSPVFGKSMATWRTSYNSVGLAITSHSLLKLEPHNRLFASGMSHDTSNLFRTCSDLSSLWLCRNPVRQVLRRCSWIEYGRVPAAISPDLDFRIWMAGEGIEHSWGSDKPIMLGRLRLWTGPVGTEQLMDWTLQARQRAAMIRSNSNLSVKSVWRIYTLNKYY